MNEFTFTMVRIVVMVAVFVVIRYFVPWAKELIEQSQYNQLIKDIYFAVRAAEQTIKAKGSGSEKKADVLAMVTESLKNKHFLNMTDKQIDDLIEAAVFVMNHPETANA